MNEYLCVGYITGAFGIKGELKVKSDFEYSQLVFKPQEKIYLGPLRKEFTIRTIRYHKQFILITLNDYEDINEIYDLVHQSIYYFKSDLKLKENEYLTEDLIGFEIVENNQSLGSVIDFDNSNSQNILLIIKGTKKYYLPKNDYYLNKIDFSNKKIYTKNVKELL